MLPRWYAFLIICCILTPSLTAVSKAKEPLWLSWGTASQLQAEELSQKDLGRLVWAKTAAPNPQGFVVGQGGIKSEPITMQVSFALTDRLPHYNHIYIAGLLAEPDPNQVDQPIIALRWSRILQEGRHRWQLQLVDSSQAITNLPLPAGYPQQGEIYTAFLL